LQAPTDASPSRIGKETIFEEVNDVNLLILGATGPTGRHVLELALKAGHTITVLARRPEALDDVKDRITVIAGDATHRDDVAKAIRGRDAVISALGTSKSLRANGLFTRAAEAVVQAARQHGVTRLVWLSSFGVGDTFRDASLLQKVMYRTLLRDIYRDKEAAETILRESGLDWTIVYPTGLTNGPAKGAYRAEARIAMKGFPTISRADVADFLLRAVRDDGWLRRHAVITD